MTGAVLVGADGSERSLTAVEVAASEARLRGVPLRVLHAVAWPVGPTMLGVSPVVVPEAELRQDAERILHTAVVHARATAPDVPVTTDIVMGTPSVVLIEASEDMSLLVIGDRGLGGFRGLLVGSVAVQLSAHAACPALVVRGRPQPEGTVLLGVDGSPANDPAVGFAFEEAALRGATLTALHAWTQPRSSEPGDMLPLVYDMAEVEDEENRVLAEALAGWRDKYPDVPVHRELLRAHTRSALLEASSRAQLVVVGTRGRGGLTGLLLGSVSQAVLHHADCPVAIVPHPHRGR